VRDSGAALPIVTEVLPLIALAVCRRDIFLTMKVFAVATLTIFLVVPSISFAKERIRGPELVELDASFNFTTLVRPKVLVVAPLGATTPGPATVALDFWLVVQAGGAALLVGRELLVARELLVGRDHPPVTFAVLLFDVALAISPLGGAAFTLTYGLPHRALAPCRIVHILVCDVGVIYATLSFVVGPALLVPAGSKWTPVSGNAGGGRASVLLIGLLRGGGLTNRYLT